MVAIVESNESAISPEQRYFIEAAKRQREDGLKQFEQIHFSSNERIRNLADDIYADHDALDKLPLPVESGGQIKFLILGAGMGGILMAIRLLKKGFLPEQIVLVEAAGGVGGTWYWNRYPGLYCDVEAYVYLPLLEEMGYMPSKKYVPGVEIREYLNRLVEHFGLQDRILFRTEASGLQWDDKSNVWKAELKMSRGSQGEQEAKMEMQAEFVTLASGIFPYPHVPNVSGLADFGSAMLHTARWNYAVTGGSSDTAFPELHKLEGKRVALIGTGATAVQVVPEVAKYAKDLYVFQRTPSQVNPRGQRDTDPAEWRDSIAAKSGWQKERIENLTENCSGHFPQGTNDLVKDGWTQHPLNTALVGTRRFGLIAPDKAQEYIGKLMEMDADHSRKLRERVASVVKDEKTAQSLTAWYPSWCKRPAFSDIYLDTFNRENVHLVDTDGKGIESITPSGVVANGQEYPCDVLIFSTGYRPPSVGGDPGSRMGVEIVGRNGRRMAEKWEEQGATTLHGMYTNAFPNLFFQGIIQASVTANYHHLLEVQSEYIASVIATAHERSNTKKGSVVLEASAAAEDAWGMKLAQGAAFFSPAAVCGPGYLNEYGEALKMPDPNDHAAMMKKAKNVFWYKGLTDYTQLLEEWRIDSKLEGVNITVKG